MPRLLHRYLDWELRLQRELVCWHGRAFKWGSTDCVHFVCACIESMTGEDYLSDISLYTNEREALNVLADYGVDDMLLGVETVLGPSLKKSQLSKGDVVMARRSVVGDPNRTGPGIGICMGDKAVFIAEKGLDEIPMSDCLRGWKIG